MQPVIIQKKELLKAIRKNRAQHHKIFQEAVAGYREKMQTLLEERLVEVQKGKIITKAIMLPLPIDRTKDYDRIIRMLEMDQEDNVEISESDFAAYVMDEWDWKQAFLSSNAMYSATAASTLS